MAEGLPHYYGITRGTQVRWSDAVAWVGSIARCRVSPRVNDRASAAPCGCAVGSHSHLLPAPPNNDVCASRLGRSTPRSRVGTATEPPRLLQRPAAATPASPVPLRVGPGRARTSAL